MGLFNTILDKLGLGKKQPPVTPATVAAAPTIIDKGARDDPARPVATATPVAPPVVMPAAAQVAKPVAAPVATTVASPVIAPAAIAPPPVTAPPAPLAISEVDVVKKLEQLAKGSGLDWKVSIVDLLKLLEIDSSREARNELAQELGCPAEMMNDSARMNIWLHKTVLKKIAENGGNIPKELLD